MHILSFLLLCVMLGGELPSVTDLALVPDLLYSVTHLALFILGDCGPVLDLSCTLWSFLSLLLPLVVLGDCVPVQDLSLSVLSPLLSLLLSLGFLMYVVSLPLPFLLSNPSIQ